uniref:BLTX101 n=1 Tax=Nephila pilipes TaxID=299642 RepID=A0A076KYZ1_NEPPI|nr:BLTX101 [Nephila pilipes]
MQQNHKKWEQQILICNLHSNLKQR